MTTTAFDDQFTDAPEPVRQPYDVAAILRRNIADLEKELQRQREQNAAATERLRYQIERVTSEWERAENDVAAARSDLQSFIDSRDAWMARAHAAEAELKAAREQEPVAWCDPVEFAEDPWSFQGFRQRSSTKYPTMPLYARPMQAPAVPEEFMDAETLEGVLVWLETQEQVINIGPVRCEVEAIAGNNVTAADEFVESSAGWLTRLVRAMLQSRAVKDSLTSQADCRACVNRGRVNGLSQETYCESCVHEGRNWRKNHFLDAAADRLLEGGE